LIARISCACTVVLGFVGMCAMALRGPPPIVQPPGGYVAVWQFLHDEMWGVRQQWKDYSASFNEMLELAFLRGVTCLDYKPGRTQDYQIKFATMVQLNLTSNKERPIRRILVASSSEVPVEADGHDWAAVEQVVEQQDTETLNIEG
jgi:hypothetical protein